MCAQTHVPYVCVPVICVHACVRVWCSDCAYTRACTYVGTCMITCRMAARIARQGSGEGRMAPRHPLSGPPTPGVTSAAKAGSVWGSLILRRLGLNPTQGHVTPSVLPGSTLPCPRAACWLSSVQWGQESPPCSPPSLGSCQRWRGP